ncbi:hypothetical protein [Pseudonocardia sp. TRM90224]|uniref:hypothetical protein n=1 Tax=Pseudonocardia sp. TRM90224 TaxID=2812678 RepID=UPI001E59B2FD|nr:hypothetical protein [Pseudonocardia sp. TRM90224]
MIELALEWTFRGAALLLWVVWWCWGRLSGATTSRLWWAAGVLAAALTSYVDPAAALLVALTGLPCVNVLLLHIVVIIAVAAIVQAQQAVIWPFDRRADRLTSGVTGLFLVALVSAWFAWPPSLAGEGSWPAVVLRASSGSLPYRALMAVALAVAAVAFLRAVLRQHDDVPAGSLRRLLRLAVVASLVVLAWAGLQFVAVARGVSGRAWAPLVLAWGVLAVMLALGTVAVAAAFIRGTCWARTRRSDVTEDYRNVVELRDWLSERLLSVPAVHANALGSDRADLLGALIETRDRIWMAQQRISEHHVCVAARLARDLGLGGEAARAFTTATVLELACAVGPACRPAEGADLSRLGGGHTEEQEARWLAAVNRARMEHPADEAAAIVLNTIATHAESMPDGHSGGLEPVWEASR